ncbi:uncharacterized protein PV09_03867 [Verruconis gallopava]|uniref:MutL C-terminal dimerisation domain-containing protein n=1 Tax=Verruconis gallopava TaxID=253628 RepID=A0A0D1XRN5_9PEZI|nr:uncharacterized protein PV09_03867 [Verruconis gallopava]KIW05351.1 hypothetical protein PV09_03867 [Verruconis gallopava]
MEERAWGKLSKNAPPPAPGSEPSLRPLPATVVARIKSSATISSLAGVVLGLLQNSLDAGSTKISVDVDFTRGNCTVEDNGYGIAPSEFAENGGLCKLYCTSKYGDSRPSASTTYGAYGTFLASLGALCLLTVTARHCKYYSTNSLIIHQSKVISRLMPAPASHQLDSRDHGARVTVRDLFGNMPVRVKQRALLAQQQGEMDKLWDELKSGITALLVAFAAPISLHMRDTTSGKQFAIKNAESNGGSGKMASTITPLLPPKHKHIVFLLRQTCRLPSNTAGAWVPVSASSRSVTIKGMINLCPCPSKANQYLSLGIHPLLKSQHNILYEHINRLFTRSRFGAIEAEQPSDTERERRKSGARFNDEGVSRRVVSCEKGVERWPMFVLTIEEKNGRAGRSEDEVLGSGAGLERVLKVLDALVGRWLEAHHFKPSGQEKKARGGTDAMNEVSVTDDENVRSVSGLYNRAIQDARATQHTTPYTGVSTVNALSRIKSSKGESLGKRPASTSSTEASANRKKPLISVEAIPSDWSRRPCPSRSTQARTEHGESRSFADDDTQLTMLASKVADEHQDGAVEWVDPFTRERHMLNAQTGMPMPTHQNVDSTRRGRRISLPSRECRPPAGSETTPLPFIDSLLERWQNPVFRPREQPIVRASFDATHSHGAIEIDSAFEEVSRLNGHKISRAALKDAEILAQVDEKFILVKLNELDEERSLLVAIDQHAADERVKIEQLLQDLCSPPDGLDRHFSSQQGLRSAVKTSMLGKPLKFYVPAREGELFRRYMRHFADWGILFDVESLGTDNDNGDDDDDNNNNDDDDDDGGSQECVIVHSLPPVIAERCRIDPRLLISLLRSESWRLAEDGTTYNGTSLESGQAWFKRLAQCPRELLDLANSRACRSAIMFNDGLSRERCAALVADLAECAFPFMCAHGRPSMVPLIEIGTARAGDAGAMGGENEEEDYAAAFGRWRRQEHQ